MIPVLISLVPGLITLVFIARGKLSLWISAIVGGAGWLVALVLRLPILNLINMLHMINSSYIIITSALMAGIFEEITRYYVLRFRIRRNLSLANILSVGLGWGLTEALLIYAMQVPISAIMFGYDWVKFLPGAFERNIAIALHIGMSFLTIPAILGGNIIYLILAIATHTIVDALAAYTMMLLKNLWITEAITALVVIAVVIPVVKYVKSYLLRHKM